MTKVEALKLALEALKMCRGLIRNNIENLVPIESPNPWFSQDVDHAITAIKEALAQPEQEPVAWDGSCVLGHCGTPAGCEVSNCCRADYTTPPHRKPLTDEEIDKLPWEPHEGNPMTFAEGLRYFARAIEAAHGIKE